MYRKKLNGFLYMHILNKIQSVVLAVFVYDAMNIDIFYIWHWQLVHILKKQNPHSIIIWNSSFQRKKFWGIKTIRHLYHLKTCLDLSKNCVINERTSIVYNILSSVLFDKYSLYSLFIPSDITSTAFGRKIFTLHID